MNNRFFLKYMDLYHHIVFILILYLASTSAFKVVCILRKVSIFIDIRRHCHKCMSDALSLKIDNLDRVSIPTKIAATFDVEHLNHETTYGPK